MKPTSFQTTPQRHYCLIVTALACDQAIEAGIIAENKVTPLLYFFIKAWKNEQIHRWLTANHSTILRENRVLTLNLLLETGDLCTISSYKTVMNNFSKDISPMVASHAESIFTDTFIP